MRLLISTKATLALALVLMLVGNCVVHSVQLNDEEEEDAEVNDDGSGNDNPMSDEIVPDTTAFERKPASSTTAPVDLDDENDDGDEEEELGPEPQPVQPNEDDSTLSAPSKEIVPAFESSTPPQVTYQSTRSKLLAIISKPGILAGIVGGAVIGILTAILLIMFIVYRMRKKDEGSYALEETKKPLSAYDYRHCPTKEFYA